MSDAIRDDLYEDEPVMDKRQEKNRQPRRMLRGSVFMKGFVLFLLMLSLFVAMGAAALTYVSFEAGFYANNFHTVAQESLRNNAGQIADELSQYFARGKHKTAAAYLHTINAEVAVVEKDNQFVPNDSVFLWQSYAKTVPTGFYSTLYVDVEGYWFYSTGGRNYKDVVYRVFFDPDFEIEDDLKEQYRLSQYAYMYRAVYPVAAGCACLLSFFCFCFLLSSAGRRNGREGIVPGPLTRFYIDVLTILYISVSGCVLSAADVLVNEGWMIRIVVIFAVILYFVITGMLYLMDIAIRLKLGKWWRCTLLYKLWSLLKQSISSTTTLLSKIPSVWSILALFAAISILEGIGVLFAAEVGEAFGIVLWIFIKIAEVFGVIYIGVCCKSLITAGRELAAGKENYRVDTSKLMFGFKEHGDSLNSIGVGISKAVEARMKSERLKTELISNVSHDIKTPLTSIINYADLICKEPSENPKITEYAEVLERQSKRLKKLMEDLVEASKATTGTLEVEAAPCEVGVLLIQAVGEYQSKLEEKGLELRVKQPEQEVKILADGRHLWRIFDNLLNNICKYAQENTRVFLSLEQKEDRVQITFRNMSKYLLEVSPEELEERFARGDRSRHEEGNGLGLSIAKNLTELQNGSFRIVIDGDLFKVVLEFPVLR